MKPLSSYSIIPLEGINYCMQKTTDVKVGDLLITEVGLVGVCISMDDEVVTISDNFQEEDVPISKVRKLIMIVPNNLN